MFTSTVWHVHSSHLTDEVIPQLRAVPDTYSDQVDIQPSAGGELIIDEMKGTTIVKKGLSR